jgi:PAS domain-containing protein
LAFDADTFLPFSASLSLDAVRSSQSTNVLQTTANPLPLINVGQSSSSQHVSVSTAGFASPSSQQHSSFQTMLACKTLQPTKQHSSNNTIEWSEDDNLEDMDYFVGDKRQRKRLANRRSAQLSRQRKKQFIEELKEENDGLRRKELILRSIPDLIVVFDSSGKLSFVSESVSRFLRFSSDELEGTSFWSCLCDDSVRLLKAAFMDSLASRQQDSETASLGEGIWELRLVDKDSSHKVVALNGVVNFTGDNTECVCSIRPRDSSSGSNGNSVHHHKISTYLQPQQSVLLAAAINNDKRHPDAFSQSSRRGSIGARVSDSGNSSGSSDTGDSGDELNTETVA